MTKKALGRGMDALFSTEQHKVEDISSNIEVKPQNLEVISDNSELQNIEDTTYNLKVISDALADAKQNPRISLWSPKSAVVLRYLRKTKPEFSISEEAGLLLEEAIKERYPELLEQVEKALAKK